MITDAQRSEGMFTIVLDMGIEPCPGHPPVTGDGFHRNFKTSAVSSTLSPPKYLNSTTPLFLSSIAARVQGIVELNEITRDVIADVHRFIKRMNSQDSLSAFHRVH